MSDDGNDDWAVRAARAMASDEIDGLRRDRDELLAALEEAHPTYDCRVGQCSTCALISRVKLGK